MNQLPASGDDVQPPAPRHGRLERVLSLPARYPLTLLWAVLMVVIKSGMLEGAPAPVASVIYAIAAPIMIPAYVVGLLWLSLGAATRLAEIAPGLFELAGVVVVGAAYVVLDRWLRAFVRRRRLDGARR